MDGLLIDSEDLYTLCTNLILEKYHRPPLPWSVKAQLQGRPSPEAHRLLTDWAQLPISPDEYTAQLSALQAQHFPRTQPLPGVPELLRNLARTRPGPGPGPGPGVHLALATSSHAANFALKTAHLGPLFSVFPHAQRVLGDDGRVGPGRGKPRPDIYRVALAAVDAAARAAGEPPVRPDECLVFEDSVPGVEAARRAGMRVVWCPHPGLRREYAAREAEVLAGRTGAAGDGVDVHQLGELGDGWAEYLPSLVDFPYERYGIVLPPPAGEAQGEGGPAVRVGDEADGVKVG